MARKLPDAPCCHPSESCGLIDRHVAHLADRAFGSPTGYGSFAGSGVSFGKRVSSVRFVDVFEIGNSLEDGGMEHEPVLAERLGTTATKHRDGVHLGEWQLVELSQAARELGSHLQSTPGW